jgi:hypothetical protein
MTPKSMPKAPEPEHEEKDRGECHVGIGVNVVVVILASDGEEKKVIKAKEPGFLDF